MSLTCTDSHWSLEDSEYQQLATLIANMVEDHLRKTSSHNWTSFKPAQQEVEHDNQSHIATLV